eukprot:Phypoly_transcript_00260.p1 GENE.Phypoly_transcript_00260~~Phypoly_transcript_00260.p1  ORF type:complete len:1826 (+),score=425.65 Phypoly_transcript_00260:56-5533(+)
MDTVDSTENVAEAVETRLNISAGTGVAVAVSSQHEDVNVTIDVELEFPHLSALKEDLEPSKTLPTPESEVFGAASKNIESVLNTLSFAHDDFLNDFGLSELFFIDGDSLVSHALRDSSFQRGGQYLQFVYLAERLLANIYERGGRFRIFFLAQHEQLWTGNALLARQLFIYHLQKNTPLPVDIISQHVDSAEWKGYLDFYQPAYVLAKFQWHEQEGVDYKSLNIIYKAVTLACHEHLLYTVALEDIEFKGDKVLCFLLAPASIVMLREIYAKVFNYITKHFIHPLNSSKSSTSTTPEVISFLEKAIEGGFDGRTSISLFALSALLTSSANKDDITIAKLYCAYLALLQFLPLSSRSHALPATLPPTTFLNQAGPFLTKLTSFMHPAFTTLSKEVAKEKPVDKLSSNFCDAIDAHTFTMFLLAYRGEGTGNAAVDAQANKIWAHLAASVPAISKEKFTFPPQPPKDLEACGVALATVRDLAQRASIVESSIVPLDSEFVAALIPDILKKMHPNESSDIPIATAKRLDWHTGSDFVDTDHLQYKEDAPQKMKWIQKGEATKKKFIDSFLVDSPVKRKLIADLESAVGREERIKRAKKALQPTKATAGEGVASSSSAKPEKGVAKKGEKEKKGAKKPGAKDKGKETGKKEKIIATATQKRASEDAEKGKEQLASISATVAKLIKGNTPVTEAVDLLDKFVKGRPADELTLEAQLKILSYVYDEFHFAKPERKLEMVPVLFVGVQTIMRKYGDKDYFTGTGPKKLVKYAYSFGFPDLAKAIQARIDSKASAEKKKEKEKESKPEQLVKIDESAILYQLKQLGAHLARPQGKVVDDRVSFLPDDWQETLLNVVDAQESALILAPTSSGKTFISFYCMESILRSDNDGVVVYLSPTKALVNQVEAEVLARFEKKYQPGKVLTGVFTRDFRKNEKDCQILVTVPECLELLLLSMEDPGWQRRIKYLIFDEIQSLGTEGGEIWEHLLLLTDAPLLALSATVNNGQQFYDWLSDVERTRNRKMHYIKYDQRYNDLRPYVYDISNTELVPLHPFHALNLRTIAANNGELPVDLKLLPEHCVVLFEALHKYLSPLKIDVSDLDPNTFFQTVDGVEWNLSMMDVVRYEQALKQRFLSSIPLQPVSPAQAILDELSGPLPAVFERQAKILTTHTPVSVLENHLYEALNVLKAKDMLPAIVFHFDRVNCVHLAELLAQRLTAEETEAREKDGTQEKIRALEAQIEFEKKRYEKHARDAQSKIETKNLPESAAAFVESYYQLLDHYNLLVRVDPRFAYLGREGSVTYEELGHLLRMKEADIKKNVLYDALRRGIAAHHAGLDKRYRQAVEKLFRMKKVRVVIATSTLAVGINMPCKSVVFAGDSPFLNTMNYRQMSGRAGRRGFDLIGHVAFFGIPEGKIKRLITSKLADMRGNLPLTIALALRLLCRYNLWNPEYDKIMSQNENKQLMLAASKRILERPFVALGKPLVALNVRHQFRYAIEYLVREGYIGLDGNPRDLCGLVNHLYFLEPANYVFVSLLKSGLFDDFCLAYRKEKDHATQLLIVLANLFCQVKLHPAQRREHIKGSPSLVVLPSLSKPFLAGIKAHNERALQTAASYIRAFTKTYNAELGQDTSLPLSNVTFAPKSLPSSTPASSSSTPASNAGGASSGGKKKKGKGKGGEQKKAEEEKDEEEETQGNSGAGEDILATLKNSAVEYYARSTFSALSGKGDRFDSATELSDSLRRGVFLDRNLIATLDCEPQGLNAYLYDFFTHKSTKALIKYNHMRRGSLYDTLKDFMLLAKALSASLLVRVPSSPVAAEFKCVADEFAQIFSEYGHLH